MLSASIFLLVILSAVFGVLYSKKKQSIHRVAAFVFLIIAILLFLALTVHIGD